MLFVFCCSIANTKPAHAQAPGGERTEGEPPQSCPTDNVGANDDPKRLTLLGVRCFKAEKYAQAYTYYHRAFEIEKSDLLRAAMGRSLHELGIYSVAGNYYDRFLDGKRAEESGEKIEKRRRQLEEDLEEQASAVRLTSFPSNSRVFVRLDNGDWVELGETPTEVRLRNGDYTFKYKRRHYHPRTVERSVGSSAEPAEVAADLYHVETAFDVRARGLKRAGTYLAIGGLPLLATGGVLFGLSADKFAEAEDYTFQANYVPAKQNRMIRKGHAYQRWAIGLTAGGSAALITGAILFFRGQAIEARVRETKSSTSASAVLRPVVSPRFVGLRGSF